MAKKYNDLAALKDDPATKALKIKEAEQTVQAQDLVLNHSDLLSPELVAQFTALQKELCSKKEQIKEIYGIEVEANTMAAMLSAHKVLEQETKDQHEALVKELKEQKDAIIAEKQAELDGLELKKKEILETTKKENAELKAKLDLERKREEEEYTYSLERSRKIENDAWADTKAKREKELAEKEEAVNAQIEVVNAQIDAENNLETQVTTLKAEVVASYEKGRKDGKAEADKSNAFEVRALKRDAEYEAKMLQAQVDSEKSRADKAEVKIGELENKLNEAYAQMRQLAADTVKSSGGVKILNGTEGK